MSNNNHECPLYKAGHTPTVINNNPITKVTFECGALYRKNLRNKLNELKFDDLILSYHESKR